MEAVERFRGAEVLPITQVSRGKHTVDGHFLGKPGGQVLHGCSFVFNAGATATIDTDNHTFEQGGVFSGSGALTKTGTGSLTLTGTYTNTYSGLTTVNAGELNLNKATGTLAVGGNLTIGDGTGGANADVVRLQASGQISSTASMATRR